MPDYTPFLLYTDQRIQGFRRRYATFIGQKEQAYADWINGLPVYEPVDYLQSVPDRNVAPVIGMLCHLHLIGKINITFTDRACRFYRNSRSEEEYEKWLDRVCYKSCHKSKRRLKGTK